MKGQDDNNTMMGLRGGGGCCYGWIYLVHNTTRWWKGNTDFVGLEQACCSQILIGVTSLIEQKLYYLLWAY